MIFVYAKTIYRTLSLSVRLIFGLLEKYTGCLVNLGSTFGLFEEMKLLASRSMTLPMLEV